jgi:arginyl-tRNA synthetase
MLILTANGENMKLEVKKIIYSYLESLATEYDFVATNIDFTVDYAKVEAHGDLATNVALKLAKICGKNPRELAQNIADALKTNSVFVNIEVAGPGFINFYLAPEFFQNIAKDFILSPKIQYPQIGNGQKVLLEFVSANPTGPLHVGHGRGAAYGSTLTNLYSALGYTVDAEYYLNDAGRQMDILSLSAWLRYIDLFVNDIYYPEKCYQGDYVSAISKKIADEAGDRIFIESQENLENAPKYSSIDDPEKIIDAAIDFFKSSVSHESYKYIKDFTLNEIKNGIKDDLAGFRVEFNSWFSEQSLYDNKTIGKVFSILHENNHLYEKEGAFWFAATSWGDEKDRVFKRSNGAYTYFAADLAYHWQKFQHDYTKIIDVFGADHHGYIPRLRAGLKALDLPEDIFSVLLVQFASLIRNGEKVAMSTRSGEFVTLVDLYNMVGVDAARYFYAMSKVQQHMDFDLDVAEKQSMDNPVFYVQYAYARISSIMAKHNSSGAKLDLEHAVSNLKMLSGPHEHKIFVLLAKYYEVVIKSAEDNAPHQLVNYLQDLASCFHSYYNLVTFISEDLDMTSARLGLLHGVAKVIKSGTSMLGVTVPDKM